MTLAVALLGTGEDWEYGVRGKLSEAHFLDPFQAALARRGVELSLARFADLDAPARHWDAAIFAYAEVRAQIVPETGRRLVHAAEAAERHGICVIHPPALARTLANKALTSQALTRVGVAMPKRMPGATSVHFPVFSNEFMSTQAKTEMIPAGAPLDPTRYNTEWIDTRHDFAGGRYFVCLRVMAVGRKPTAVLIRARSTAGADPSVHNKNTPRDPALLDHLHRTIVVPRAGEIEALCERIGAAFGLGFYAHDVLVERDGGRLMVCETGFKFEDASYRERISPIAAALTFDAALTAAFAERAADRFADQLPLALARPG